jgi:NADH-quinone oxidoreductase subunit H
MCYQLILGLIFVAVVLLTGGLNLSKILEAQQSCWLVLPLFPLFVIFILSGLAGSGSSPFDNAKSEELRAGYEAAYTGISLWFFMVSEYVLLLSFSALATILFLGGWLPPSSVLPSVPGIVWFLGKTVSMLFAFLWIKASVPQVPQDQFISYSAKIFLPFTVGWIILAAAIKLILDI